MFEQAFKNIDAALILAPLNAFASNKTVQLAVIRNHEPTHF